MYQNISLQPPGIGLGYGKPNLLFSRVFLSSKDDRSSLTQTTWLENRWNNTGGHGWYTIGPLNMVQWDA